tara:strand:+ start:2053 stop:2994 length:942 start_codon:yes stop_codon:yes gene_type:complete
MNPELVALLEQENPMTVLAVDDDFISMNFILSQITALGHKTIQAHNGVEAIEVLQKHKNEIDVVLMDREMPVMNGLTAVKKIKDTPSLKNIPIIMVTGADTMSEMKEGLDSGVFYYLTKPVEEEMLRSVLSAALREAKQSQTLSEELGRHKISFNLIETCKFKFQTLEEVESLAAFVANCFDEPDRVISGLGELMTNAVEHGNLKIGYDKKTELLTRGIWRSEIQRLQKMPENADLYATIIIAHKENGTYAIIEDQGEGFDWQKYMSIDPARAGDNHGRGIAQANSMSFDELKYNQEGNQAIAFVGKEKALSW